MNISSFPALIGHAGAALEAPAFFVNKQVKHLFLLADPFLVQSGQLAPLLSALDEAGLTVTLYSDFAGEPKMPKMREIVALARDAKSEAVLGVGGGSTLDMAKILSITLVADRPPEDYWMMATPLPEASLPSIMIPTTAGTGSESCSTNIISSDDGHKGWVWGPQTKPDLIILDPELGASLPPRMTGWCGMDALIHAFEAASNRYGHISALSYAHQALRIGKEALPLAVAKGDDLEARTNMLLASSWAGAAIDQVGTSVAHHISHAMATLGPIHHGRATAIGFEITLRWLCDDSLLGDVMPEDGVRKFTALAEIFGCANYHDLPQALTDFMDKAGIDRTLPPHFAAFDKADLKAQLLADYTQSMRVAAQKEVSETVIDWIIEELAALPVHETD